jgi:hypothetical protein
VCKVSLQIVTQSKNGEGVRDYFGQFYAFKSGLGIVHQSAVL